MNLELIQLKLQELSCDLSYATKQDLHISLDFQQIIDSALQVIEKVLSHSGEFLTLKISDIRDILIQKISDTPEKYGEITDILDALDGLESLLTRIRLMLDAAPEFLYKETVQQYNQV